MAEDVDGFQGLELEIDVSEDFNPKHIGNKIPESLCTEFDVAHSQIQRHGVQVKKQVFLSAVIEEGLKSDSLRNTVLKYEEKFKGSG